MNGKLVLIDGNSIINRAFYGIPDLTNSEGLHTNAVYGFLNILFKILDEEKPDYLAVAFDVKHPTFRHEKYAAYKGTRKPMPGELAEQVPLLKEMLTAMEIAILEKAGYEADDILGTLARMGEQNGLTVALVSGDRDLLQLASETVKIRIPKTKQGRTEVEDYYTADVIEKYGVTPAQIIDLKGLMGDASDNIPGVPGIGEKTAVKILSSFQTVENAYEHVEEVTPNRAREALREHYDMAVLSKELATIKTDCDLDFRLEQAQRKDIYKEAAFKLMKRLEFKSMLSRFDVSMGRDEDTEELFIRVDKEEEARAFFDRLSSLCRNGGFVLGMDIVRAQEKENMEEGGIRGVSFAYFQEDGTAECVYISSGVCGGISGQINRILSGRPALSVIDLKKQLPGLSLTGEDPVWDLAIAAYLLNPLKDSYTYEDIARDYLNRDVPSFAERFGKKKPEEAAGEPDFYKFCCYGAYISLLALAPMKEALAAEDMTALYEEIEMPLVFTLYEMECRGVRVNREALREYGENLVGRIQELEQEIHRLAGEEFNINSPKQLGVILFEKLRLPFGKKTKTGYSTSADILEKLQEEYPIVAMVLEYRQLTKLKSTYADGLAAYIEEDGRIHGKFNQTVAATGRLSSTEPNLQNIPIRMELGRQIRKVFIPEEGFVFLDGDYSQIELRILAHMSGDERLIAAYGAEQDIHKITASEVFHTPLSEVTPAQRSSAKAVNFGIVYGISSFGLGQGLHITRKEAESYIKKYFETYPGVKLFLDGLVEEAKKKGCVTSLFHRKRPVPELSSSNFMQRSFGERVAMNSPIQGTAADIIKIAMNRVNRRLKKEGLQSRLILQIHDELLIEAPREEAAAAGRIMEEEMFHAAQLKVPLEVEIKEGGSWFDAK